MNPEVEKRIRDAAGEYLEVLVEAWLKTNPPTTAIDDMIDVLKQAIGNVDANAKENR